MKKDNITLRDELLLDFINEANQEITTQQMEDDSYNFMLDNLDTRWLEKDKEDKSLTEEDVAYIKTLISNEEYTLQQSYVLVVSFLCNEQQQK